MLILGDGGGGGAGKRRSGVPQNVYTAAGILTSENAPAWRDDRRRLATFSSHLKEWKKKKKSEKKA